MSKEWPEGPMRPSRCRLWMAICHLSSIENLANQSQVKFFAYVDRSVP